MIILKVTKSQDFTLSLENTFLEKPQRGKFWKVTSKNKFVVVKGAARHITALLKCLFDMMKTQSNPTH